MQRAEAKHPTRAVSSDHSVPSNLPLPHYSPQLIETRQGKDTPVECDKCLGEEGSAWLLGQSAQQYSCMAQLSMQEQGKEVKRSGQGEDVTCSPKPEDGILSVQMLLRLLVFWRFLTISGFGDLLIFVTLLTRLPAMRSYFPAGFLHNFFAGFVKWVWLVFAKGMFCICLNL